jgi:hypothetical protein
LNAKQPQAHYEARPPAEPSHAAAEPPRAPAEPSHGPAEKH